MNALKLSRKSNGGLLDFLEKPNPGKPGFPVAELLGYHRFRLLTVWSISSEVMMDLELNS
jgi:hypothetical protein